MPEHGRAAEWLELRTPEELTIDALNNFSPRTIFFPHWSYIVPTEIVHAFECICFHETPVPYGRGGSPIQNMILRGHQETKITALRMVDEVDAGPIYLQRPFSLLGGGDEIFIRLSAEILRMMEEIILQRPIPRPQVGEPTVFKRRKPHESELPSGADLEAWFDRIRMLDAEGYPNAFLDFGGMRLTFSRAVRRRDHIEATVVIHHTER